MGFTSDKFIIGEIKSSDIGVDGCYIIKTNGESEIGRQLMGEKSIVSDTIRYRNTPWFYTVEKSVIEFDLKFSLLDKEFDDLRLMELGEIFAKDKYQKFISCDFVGMEFFVICSSFKLVTFGQFKGWIEAHLVTSSSNAYAPLQCIDKDFSDLTTTQTFEIDAKFNVMDLKTRDYHYYPKLLIDMKGISNSITITNLSDNNRSFGFTELTTLESLEIDNDLKEITSSTGNYRLNNMINNHAWFRLVRGVNRLTINKPAIIQIQTRYPIYL